MPQLKLYLFGAPRIKLDEQPVVLPQRRKILAILIYLAMTRQAQRRDALATLLWPDTGQQNARTSLRRELYAINNAIGEGWMLTTREEIGLNTDADIWVDVEEFRRLLNASEQHEHPEHLSCDECLSRLTNATEIYQEGFLAGYTLADTPEFDEWQLFEADTLGREYAEALDTLIHMHEYRGDYGDAIDFARRRLALDAMHEPAHRILIRLYAFAGQRASAIRQYKECKRLLGEALGVSLQDETTELFESIQARRFPNKPASSGIEEETKNKNVNTFAETEHALASPLTQSVAKQTLPPQPTSFIGRVQELAEIKQILHRDGNCQLLTLLGPGGIGKTRLAIEVAHGLADAFPDGIFFVGLASVGATENIGPAIADALDFQLQGASEPKAELANYLRTKRLLLVIDNLEHLLDGAAILAELMASAAGIKILITSREALGLQEEWLYQLAGLSFPEHSKSQDHTGQDHTGQEGVLQAAVAYDAVALFGQRAKQIERQFSLRDELRHVMRICSLVDGMPLALELAATWLHTLPASEIANEIEEGLDILTSQHRNIPERHRSMRVVCEQTWRYLPPIGKEALKRLSIFSGGFQREAAAEVADSSIATLALLLDKSILRRNNDRYHLHELLRQFAIEKLDEDGATSKTQEAHAAYYLSWLADQGDALRGVEPASTCRTLRLELDNLRQAWGYAISAGMLDLLYYCFETMAYFYEFAGLQTEGQKVFIDAADKLHRSTSSKDNELATNLVCHFQIKGIYFSRYLEEPYAVEPLETKVQKSLRQSTDPLCQAAYLSATGLYDFLAGRPEQALPSFQEADPLYRRWGTQYQLAGNLQVMGEAHARLGKLDEAEALLNEALALSAAVEDIRGRALTISHMGVLAFMREDFPLAYDHFSRAVSLFEQMGDLWRAERTENNRGFTLLYLEEYKEALQSILRALGRQEMYDASSEKGYLYDSLGQAYFAMGDLQNAQAYYQKTLAEARAHDMAYYVVEALIRLAQVDIVEGKFEGAKIRLEQAALHLAEVPSPLQSARLGEIEGDLLSATGKNQDALQRYTQAIAHYKEAGNRHECCSATLSKGRILLELQRQDEAYSALKEALDLAQQVGRRSVIRQAEQLLSCNT